VPLAVLPAMPPATPPAMPPVPSSAPALGTSAVPAGADAVFGLLRLAGMDVAVPLASLREVVPCPLELAGLPVAADGLLGAMQLRTLVLPVLDLRPLIGRPAPRTPDQVTVVVAHGGSALGLLVDEVRGMVRVPAETLLPVTATAGELLFDSVFLHPETGCPISVLDAAAVLGRPGVPVVRDLTRAAAPHEEPGDGAGAPVRRLVTVRCGGSVLALDVASVHTTLPGFAARPSVLTGPLCHGVVDFAGHEVPVVDPLVLLGLGGMSDDAPGAGLVLDLGHGYVVLALDELLDLVEVSTAEVLPFPPAATRRPDLVTGTVQPGGAAPCLVLDGTALMAEPDLVSLATVNTLSDEAEPAVPSPRSGAEGAADGTDGAGRPYLLHSAGVDVATPLDQVGEILPFPADLLPADVGGAVLGVAVHRRAAVPVVDLATVLGRSPAGGSTTSCLLLVEVDGAQVAFAIGALRGIEPLTWRDPEQARRGSAVPGPRVLQTAPLVQLGSEARLLPDIDLRVLAREFAGVDEPERNAARDAVLARS
jgi:purine-binding chemotaxis protein CheW